jgi:CheY-like chemotaxis protein
LPLKVVGWPGAKFLSHQTAVEAGGVKNMNVIVCSGNPAVVAAVSQLFDHGEHRQTICESGLEVLGLVGVLASDLLVLDLETPGLGGLLLIAAIRELAPELPIVAISTQPAADARVLAQKGVPFAQLGERPGEELPALFDALAHVEGKSSGVGAGPR